MVRWRLERNARCCRKARRVWAVVVPPEDRSASVSSLIADYLFSQVHVLSELTGLPDHCYRGFASGRGQAALNRFRTQLKTAPILGVVFLFDRRAVLIPDQEKIMPA